MEKTAPLTHDFLLHLTHIAIDSQIISGSATSEVSGSKATKTPVSEALHKTGVRNIRFFDFDTVGLKNLDRLQGIGMDSIGKLKIEVIKKSLQRQRLFKKNTIKIFPYSIIEEEGLPNALDCDIIFCCVDRPWPRYVLNCISFANCIPAIGGGVEAAINKKK